MLTMDLMLSMCEKYEIDVATREGLEMTPEIEQDC